MSSSRAADARAQAQAMLPGLAEAPIRDFIATLRCLLDGTRATETRLAYAARTLHPGGGPLSHWLTLALLDRLEEISR